MGGDSSDSKIKWQIERRREFIEHRLFWHGQIGLADLIDTFGIARTQASQDINSYINAFPEHLAYDKSARTYVVGPKFSAHYADLSPSAHLSKLLAMSAGLPVHFPDWESYVPDMLAPPIPARGAKPEITRAVLHAIEQGRALTITYQSMSSRGPSERSIAPHALAHDGFRWHCRAFCLRDQVFKDFVLGRMLSADLGEPVEANPKSDTDWMTDITLTIAPNPALLTNQQKIVALDYGMEEGSSDLTVRRCMLYYALRRLGLDTDPSARRAQEQHIVLLNAQEVFGALGKEVPW
jgi:predicted DNA-binding transcriptional regulator YafY